MINASTALPTLLAGPILRDCNERQFTLWFVTKQAYQAKLRLFQASEQQSSILFEQQLTEAELHQVQVGERAFINLVSISLETPLPSQCLINYDLLLLEQGEEVFALSKNMPELCYEQQPFPSFAIKPNINELYHGSCRKPHFAGGDGLVQIDKQLAQQQFAAEHRPSLLMMSGDQVYVDDVSGPMLNAIHQVIQLLGLYDEQWQNEIIGGVSDSQQLFNHPQNYYHREKLLPHDSVNPTLWSKIFGASKRPIFTSVNAKNHLVTLSEVIAMYLLTWSPKLWHVVDLSFEAQPLIPKEWMNHYQSELDAINEFVKGLEQVQRVMAHVPVYMIFDDHDITDDWNLTRGWEEAAYTHPFSKRIIGNALIGYYLCQGWGNCPSKFNDIVAKHDELFTEYGLQQHNEFVDELLAFDQWHYQLNTTPKLLVLDTRTQRWRSESNPGKPSGLMDWESLTELQTQLINEPCVIMVSAAPIYGVKLIEAVQRVFTFFGNPLAVDAENWMAHKGTANVMLNIFRNRKTPPQFIILSGDVHYSFVYDVSHRFIRSSSRIVQITCSGIKNQFPEKLIHILERLNYYLYGTNSPLNWFTKRRRMKIKVRKPSNQKNKTVYNGSGIGVLKLSDDFQQVDAQIMSVEGELITFDQSEETT